MKTLIVPAIVFLGATAAWAGKDIPVADLPQPAFDALVKKFPQARIISVEKDTEQGRESYEIDFDDGGTKKEATVLADGTISEVKND